MSGHDGFEAPIHAMYFAGKRDIPAEAAMVSRVGSRLYSLLETLNTQTAPAGDPKVMTSMLDLGETIYHTLRRAEQQLENCAVGVIRTADDFVANDRDARRDFHHLNDKLKHDPIPHYAQPPKLGNLTAPGAPVAPIVRPGLGDFLPHPDDPTTLAPTPDPGSADDDVERRREVLQRDGEPPVVRPGSSS